MQRPYAISAGPLQGNRREVPHFLPTRRSLLGRRRGRSDLPIGSAVDGHPLQSALRIRIQASDVSLVLQPPLQTSIRNILRAKVAQCLDDNGQVEVQLEVGSKKLWARISPWARDELGIKPGLWLYAQIKSVSITT